MAWDRPRSSQVTGRTCQGKLEWEIDPAALQVSARACQRHRKVRGDFLQEDAAALAKEIQAAQGGDECIVLATAEPPCPDYSHIRGADAPGRGGQSGQLLLPFLGGAGVRQAVRHFGGERGDAVRGRRVLVLPSPAIHSGPGRRC